MHGESTHAFDRMQRLTASCPPPPRRNGPRPPPDELGVSHLMVASQFDERAEKAGELTAPQAKGRRMVISAIVAALMIKAPSLSEPKARKEVNQ
jgi:hypothetical protein